MPTLLSIEDDPVFQRVIRRNLAKLDFTFDLTFANSGREALELLQGGKIPSPFLILLDLNMPGMTGIEFLECIRGDLKFRHSVVFVLSTSDDERDRRRAFAQHVAGYFVKHQDKDDFPRIMRMLVEYMELATFPPTIEN